MNRNLNEKTDMVGQTKAIEPKIETISRHMSWFVGRALSYIDITVDAPKDPGDKYPKKEVLKKLFEKEIYDTRNQMYDLSEKKVIESMPTMFDNLVTTLIRLSSASISDSACRQNFTELINQSATTVQDKIKLELKG